MQAVALLCVLSSAYAWKMPASSLLEKPGKKQCEIAADFHRLPTLEEDTKWKGSQRLPTAEELADKDYLAEPYLHTVYYINLDKSKDRAEHMEKVLSNTAPGVHAERFPAKNMSDAKILSNPTGQAFYSVNREHRQAFGGTAATYLSHWHMLEKISKHPDNSAVFVVLEDDAQLVGNWSTEIMCQIKQLPADWDLYKFGYWPLPTAHWAYDHSCSGGLRQKAYNEYTCNQRSFALEWMGNLGYAVRPRGAKRAIEHLRQVPVMDVDGAMMPGCCVSNSTKVTQNVYVSRYSLVRHGKFGSVRLMDKQVAGVTADLSVFSGADDDRESSYQARVRLTEAAKRGELANYEDTSMDEETDESKAKDKVTALAGLGA